MRSSSSGARRRTSADAVFYIQKGKVKITVVSEQGKEAVGTMAAVPPDRLNALGARYDMQLLGNQHVDYRRETLAIQDLARQMVDHPEELMS